MWWNVQVALSITSSHLLCMQIILSVAEHHSNLVPWHMLAARTGAKLRFVPLTKDGTELDMAVSLSFVSSITKKYLLMFALCCMQPFRHCCHAAGVCKQSHYEQLPSQM